MGLGFFKRIKSGDRSEWKRPQEFAEQKKIIEDRFYDRPLKEMAPVKIRNAENIADILNQLELQTKELIYVMK